MTDDMLDYHASMFIAFDTRQLCGITFQQFLNQPDFYINRSITLIYGEGLNVQNGMTITAEFSWH